VAVCASGHRVCRHDAALDASADDGDDDDDGYLGGAESPGPGSVMAWAVGAGRRPPEPPAKWPEVGVAIPPEAVIAEPEVAAEPEPANQCPAKRA